MLPGQCGPFASHRSDKWRSPIKCNNRKKYLPVYAWSAFMVLLPRRLKIIYSSCHHCHHGYHSSFLRGVLCHSEFSWASSLSPSVFLAALWLLTRPFALVCLATTPIICLSLLRGPCSIISSECALLVCRTKWKDACVWSDNASVWPSWCLLVNSIKNDNNNNPEMRTRMLLWPLSFMPWNLSRGPTFLPLPLFYRICHLSLFLYSFSLPWRWNKM